MRVWLYDEDDNLVWKGDLATFAADNELEPDELDEATRELTREGVLVGGGGAAPSWRLVREGR